MSLAGPEETGHILFFRITLLGSSSCGKTSLISSFVNGCFLQRQKVTDKAVVYHRRVEIQDDSNATVVRKRTFLVEVEDTPGSERGQEDDDDAAAAARTGGEVKLKKGDRIKIRQDKRKVVELFRAHPSLEYRPDIDPMLGRACSIKAVYKDGSVAVVDNSGCSWELPMGAVEPVASLELPIDEFLHLSEKPRPTFNTLAERKQYNEDLTRPLSAYVRPVGGDGMDKTLTKNRMGFFLCFDLSDETGDSLKEAVALYRMVKAKLARIFRKTAVPILWLVGCKADKTGLSRVVKNNMRAASAFSDEVMIPFYVTSARKHEGVQRVFERMAAAIHERYNLWNLSSLDGEEGGEQEEGGFCHSQ